MKYALLQLEYVRKIKIQCSGSHCFQFSAHYIKWGSCGIVYSSYVHILLPS